MIKYLTSILLVCLFCTFSYAATGFWGGGGVVLRTSTGETIEDILPSIVTTSIDHWIVHMGASYTASDTLSVPAGATYEFYIRNNVSTGTHMTTYSFVSTQGDAAIDFYEGGTVAFNGATSVPRNNNRNYSDSAEVEVFTNASTTALGLQLEHDIIIGGKQAGGSGGSVDEWVLNQNTIYIIRYINNSGQADVISYHFDFLEVNLLP